MGLRGERAPPSDQSWGGGEKRGVEQAHVRRERSRFPSTKAMMAQDEEYKGDDGCLLQRTCRSSQSKHTAAFSASAPLQPPLRQDEAVCPPSDIPAPQSMLDYALSPPILRTLPSRPHAILYCALSRSIASRACRIQRAPNQF